MITFKINSVNNNNGPGIFGSRLKSGLVNKGWVWDSTHPDYNICFASGQYKQGSMNILRLDNLYFDSKNTIGNTDMLNAPIKQAYNTFDKIIFQSDFARKQYQKHFSVLNTPNKVIYNGVPKEFRKEGEAIDYGFEKTFICSADWRAHKRLEPIIKAFKCFDKKDKYGLVILGNCKHKVNHPNIVYPGKIIHTDLPKYIRGADVGVHLSWLDCSPNVVYEMIACGLPVLCSHNGGTKEIVKNDGIILKLEEDYKYNRVDLYHPPMPDIDVVYWGMQNIIERSCSFRNDLYVDSVVQEYISFIIN